MGFTVRPRLPDIINRAIEKLERGMSVAMPGVVQSFDSTSRTVNVKPAVSKLIPDFDDPEEDVAEEYAVVYNVPVCWPVARGFALTNVTLAAGDPVLLVVCDRDLTPWRLSGGAVDPVDARLHDVSSCVAIPGLLPDSNPFPTPTDAAALASVVDAFARAISNLAVPTDAGTALTAIVGVINAFKAAYPSPLTSTCASQVLKLGS